MSFGFEQAGFETLCAIDNDPKAVEVLKTNLRTVKHVLCRDLTSLKPRELSQRTLIAEVDVVIGGPPCQGYSVVRQRDGANNGARLIQDDRRTLYRHFLSFVQYFKPALFLMENVLGMRSAEGGQHLENFLEACHQIGYEVVGGVVQASDFGIPQSRRRLLFVGSKKGSDVVDSTMLPELLRAQSPKLVSSWEAIGDLPPLQAGEGQDPTDFDDRTRQSHEDAYPHSEYSSKIKDTDVLTAHVARPHSARDLRDFARLREGENSKQALDRGVKMEFPYNREVFTDRYSRLAKDRPSRSILAHMSKDGLMYIHPEQVRSLTPREAARLQSFPDSFQFPVARTHQYRLIGNAVPPLLAEAIANRLKRVLNDSKVERDVAIR